MKRSAPLRAKAPPKRAVRQIDYTPRPRKPAEGRAAPQTATPRPKAHPWRSEAYRRLVAALPCAHCGMQGHSQAAHADEGKGLSMKACDSTCYPLCGPRLGMPGCHHLIGTSGAFSRMARREIEHRYSEQTRARLADECRSLGINLPGMPPAGSSTA